MQLSREEFWILDATAYIQGIFPLYLFNDPEAIAFNKPYHNLTTDQLVDLLEVMQKKGNLAIFRYSKELFPSFDTVNVLERAPKIRIVVDYTPVWESLVFYPKSVIVEDFIIAAEEQKKDPWGLWTRRKPLCCCMTHQGAEKWEQTAQVDWNKYFDCFSTTANYDTDLAENQSLCYGRAAALSKQTLDAYFEWKTRWDAHPDMHETASFRRYHTERIAPWKATYWKTFPEGFECDFTEYTVHRHESMDYKEHARRAVFWKRYWDEHHALFGWHNRHIKDFPFVDS